MIKPWHLPHRLALIGLLVWTATHSAIGAPQLWLAPPDTVTQPESTDFAAFFQHPEQWKVAASRAEVFSVAVNYLVKSPSGIAKRLLSQVAARRLKLNVGLSLLQVDKKICGDGLEGMVWPGEVALYAQQLKILGADVASFGFDLPLTSGSIAASPNACRFPVRETARRISEAVMILRRFYPNAAMIDTEVPTGMPVAKWSLILDEWLAAYRAASGSEFDGFAMDVWYKGPWLETVRATTTILAKRGIPAGVILDASEGSSFSPEAWVAETKHIECDLEASAVPVNFIVVANWLDLRLKNLPETNPNTLTGLFDWVARDGHCLQVMFR